MISSVKQQLSWFRSLEIVSPVDAAVPEVAADIHFGGRPRRLAPEPAASRSTT